MQGRVENLLGAIAIAVGDEIREAVEGAAGHGSGGPAALSSLVDRPGQSIESLRRTLSLSHSATVRLVDRLEDDGLVMRRPAVDGREVGLVLTARGRRRAMRVHQQRRAVLSRAVAGLSTQERRELEATLERLVRTQAVVHDDPRPICRLCEMNVCPLRSCPNPAAR
ncbi:MAG: MarR family transcriptional regulator [Acidimicrobiia bacterium]|nr:MarR family transcriptional regulator [Acidimicrobiia bacterium]